MTQHAQNLKIKLIDIQNRINRICELRDNCTNTRQMDLYDGGLLVLEEQFQNYQMELRFETRNDEYETLVRDRYFD